MSFLFDKEIRKNFKQQSEVLIEKLDEMVKTSKELTAALREMRRTLKQIEKKL